MKDVAISVWLGRGPLRTLVPAAALLGVYAIAARLALSPPYLECRGVSRMDFAVLCRPLRDINSSALELLGDRKLAWDTDLGALGFHPVIAPSASDELPSPQSAVVVTDSTYEPAWLVASGEEQVVLLVDSALYAGPQGGGSVIVTWRGPTGPGLLGPLGFILALTIVRLGAWKLARDSRDDIEKGRWTATEAMVHGRLERGVAAGWWVSVVLAVVIGLGLTASVLLPDSRYGELGAFWWLGGLVTTASLFLGLDAIRSALAWIVDDWEDIDRVVQQVEERQKEVEDRPDDAMGAFLSESDGTPRQPFELVSMAGRRCLQRLSLLAEPAKVQLMVLGVPAKASEGQCVTELFNLGLIELGPDGRFTLTEDGEEILSMPPSLLGLRLPGAYAAPLALAQQAASGRGDALKRAVAFTRILMERLLKDLLKSVFADAEQAFQVLHSNTPSDAEREILVLWESTEGDIDPFLAGKSALGAKAGQLVDGWRRSKNPGNTITSKAEEIRVRSLKTDRSVPLEKATLSPLNDAVAAALKGGAARGLAFAQGGEEVLSNLNAQKRQEGLRWLLEESWPDRNLSSHDGDESMDPYRARWAVDTARMTAKLLVSAGVKPS